jgi:hypothetical protein
MPKHGIRLNTFGQAAILALLFPAIILSQWAYDVAKISAAALPQSFSPSFIRMFDMGFDSTVGSFLWVGTMPEILDLFRGKTEYLQDERFVNAVDPKLSYPYAFSTLTLPAVAKYPDAMKDAMAIGEAGIQSADPDWRIPYYMAINYFLELKDGRNALKYFDIAARTPGIPDFARRFALNFGIGSNERAKVKELWATIRDSTKDEFTKERAQAYIDRLDMFDYLEAAAKIYKQKFGAFPASPDELVQKGIIPSLPQDPFGFTFIIKSDGTAGIDVNKIPPESGT